MFNPNYRNMKCVRCRNNSQISSGLCSECNKEKSKLTKKEEAILKLYTGLSEKPYSIGILGYHPGQEDLYVDEMIEGMDSEGNISNDYLFSLNMKRQAPFLEDIMGPDYEQQMKRYVSNYIQNITGEQYFSEEPAPHYEVDSLCSDFMCNKSKYQLCDHLSTEERMKILYELKKEDDLQHLTDQNDFPQDILGQLYLVRLYIDNNRLEQASELLDNLEATVHEDELLSMKYITTKIAVLLETDLERAMETLQVLQSKLTSFSDDDIQAIGEWQGFLMLVTGDLYVRSEQDQQALKTYSQALLTYKDMGEKFGMAKAMRKLAYQLVRKEQTNEAMELIEKSIGFFNDLGVKDEIYRSQTIRASILFANEEFFEAQGILEDCIEYFERNKIRFERERILSYTLISQLYITNGDMGRGESYGLKAIELAGRVNDFQVISATMMSMLMLYLRAGELQKASELIHRIKIDILELVEDSAIIDELVGSMDELINNIEKETQGRQYSQPWNTDSTTVSKLPKFCKYCGSQFSLKDKFCVTCGKKREY